MKLLMIEALEPRRFFSSSVRFAVIGDYGAATPAEADVAKRVRSWNPAFIVTTGDNNYPEGSAVTIDANVGRDYHRYLHNYAGQFGKGASKRRFYPSLGNHDWQSGSSQPYTDFFDLPVTSASGGERYYDFASGPVHFFAIDSDEHEPDGVTADSVQGQWLHAGLSAATEPFKIVFFHHPPFSSGPHGSTATMQWPFKDWGASLVLSGHDHIYERLSVDGLTYVVNGLGGVSEYEQTTPNADSQLFYNADFGAMRFDASSKKLSARFVTRAGKTIDQFTIDAPVIPPSLAIGFESGTLTSIEAGKRTPVVLTLQNRGADWRGKLSIDLVFRSPASVRDVALSQQSINVHLKPSAAKRVRIRFKPNLPAGAAGELLAFVRLKTEPPTDLARASFAVSIL